MLRILLIPIVFGVVSSFAQGSLIDSVYSIIDREKSKDEQAEQIRMIGVQLKNSGNSAGAIVLYTHALQLFNETKNKSGEANCLNNLGVVYWRTGNRLKATESYLNSARLNDSLNNRLGLAKNHINLGNLFTSYNEHQKALSSFQSANDILLALQDSSELLALTAMNLGNLYSDIDNPARDLGVAKKNYHAALKRFYILGDTLNISGIYNNYGLIHENEDHLDSALIYYKKALHLRQSNNDINGLMISNLNIGNIYRKQKKVSLAVQHYDAGLQYAKKTGDAVNHLYLLKNKLYVSLESQSGNLDDQFKQYETLRDSLFNQEKSKQIAELETKYESEKKQLEIDRGRMELNQKSLQNRNLAIGLCLTVFAAALIVVLILQRNRMIKIVSNKNDLIHTQQIGQILKEQERKTFDAMLEGQDKERVRIAEDLHDRLGSTLTAAKLHFEAIQINGGSKAFELLDNAIDETRQIAHNMLSGVLTKFGLYAALLDLKETIESTNRIAIQVQTIQFDDRLTSEQEVNLYRITQEFISNTLKHARATQIIIRIEKSDNNVLITLEDNGIGYDMAQVTNGMGTKNIEARTKKINATCKSVSGIGSGTKLYIALIG
jgi:two-component system, NarL family, sensor kinase